MSDLVWFPPNLLLNAYRLFFPWGQQAGVLSDKSSPFHIEVKHEFSYTSDPLYALTAYI